ncbi:hypothetical protein Mal15_25790 [Stieleria maiorica]|uniref:Uncharacterized protein n=1 Tax=Stieleria maiorica TaxID=2795974 RepID=A0A5B9MHG6_9BACT|nr:hypothetical protein [Stieleria maiorica]QEF98527.1 hypothetical protein Mal15_25790 [Stieleria maiorica]
MEDKLGIGLKERTVRVGGPRVRVGPTKHCNTEPEVRVVKDGNRIESIVIACACGEEITVVCGYDENQTT